MMKILAPVKNLFFGIEVIKAGADEIYFGVVSNDWIQKYNYLNPLNGRSMFHSIRVEEDAKKLIDFANSKNVHTYITLNRTPPFVDEKLLEEEIKKVLALKPTGIIFKDIFIAEIIRKFDKDIDLHCSSLNQVLNKDAISFWVEKYNVKRIIFPRNIAINEIIEMCNLFPNLEFEIFVKNSWCYNSDGICSSMHEEATKKGLKYVCFREEDYKAEDEDFDRRFLFFNNDLVCKVCIMGKLKELKNLVSIKIVGRDKTLPRILGDLNFVKKTRDYLYEAKSYEDFVETNIKNHTALTGRDCGHNKCEFYKYYYNK